MLFLQELINGLPITEATTTSKGRVSGIQGQTIIAKIPNARLGDICSVEISSEKNIYAQVVSFSDSKIILAPFSDIRGIAPGSLIIKQADQFGIKIPDVSGGLVIDALGNVLKIDQHSKSIPFLKLDLSGNAPNALTRKPVNRQLVTGIKSIDTLCSIGYGQRLGLFAAAGLGKSTLLGMLARGAEVDVCVIALTGERGREVSEFINDGLGPQGLAKSVVVVATSDKPALQRSLAAMTATSIAEHFRRQGKRVLLLVDSLTRTARAIRDVSLAAGEMPIRQGLTSSVYSELPRLIERAGNDASGSITAIYTLLDSSEYEPDPLAEEVKSLLDGHICLSSYVAAKGVRPAIDFTKSISRCYTNILSPEQLESAKVALRIINKLKKEKDLILMGGTGDPELKACMAIEEEIDMFLHQTTEKKFSIEESMKNLNAVIQNYKKFLQEIKDNSL